METGGEEDAFIRTRVKPEGGSTAYGPLQVTRTLAEDYRERKVDLFTEEELTYLDRFIEQAKRFTKYGGTGKNPRYDYGGEGDLTSEEDREMYAQVFTKVFKDRVGDNPTAEEIARKWHGGSDESLINDYVDKLVAAGV